jgi:heme oxygenase
MELLDEIRAATRLQHKSLEGEWDLVPGLLRVQDRCTILRALYQVHAPSELALLPWLTGLPDLGYRQRLKAPLLRADLKDLGASEPDLIWPAEQLPQIQNSAWALGFTYVLEGSTLGGQVIRKAVVAAAASLVGLSFFGVYGRDTGSRWKQFCHVLERECRTRREDCARGAVAGFDFVSTIFQSSLDRTRPARLTER